MQKISIVIPAYNEEAGIGKTINQIPKSEKILEIIVVDNNSTDKTAEVARGLGTKVIKETRQGYGYALREGFKNANGDIIITLDADVQYPGEKILELVEYFENNNLDFLSCSRFPLQNKNSLSFTRIWGNKLLTLLANSLWGLKLKDSQSGMMIFKKEILGKIKLESGDMPLSQELKIKAILAGFKFAETNIPYHPRRGESKLFPIKHGLKNSWHLISIWFPHFRERKVFDFVLIGSLILIFFILASFNLNKPFINVTSDVNGENGLAILNWMNAGLLKMKFGKYVGGYLANENAFDFEEAKINKEFYTHHPVLYLLPGYVFYKLFGVSEITTRASVFVVFTFAIVFFYFALKKIFSSNLISFLISLIFVFLPGTIYYGTTYELAVFSLPAALISFSLFVFYYSTKKNVYFYFLLVSIFLGGLVGWFYFFMPASIWFYLLFDKNKNCAEEREKLLIFLPIVSISAFYVNLLHVYTLRGWEGLVDLKNAFLGRSSRIPFGLWLQSIYMRAQLNFNDLFLWLSILGLLLFVFVYFKKHKILTPLILMPALNTFVFFQWSTHPFGIVFFLPAVAIFSFLSLKFISQKIEVYGFVAAAIILIIAFYFSYQKLNFFINKFLILGEKDTLALIELKNQVKDGETCLGQNQMGLYYGGIAMWYLRKNIYFSPNCLEEENKLGNLRLAVVFHPQLGEFYLNEANKFAAKGFKPIGCADVWCFLEK